jgi:hypothetical protein
MVTAAASAQSSAARYEFELLAGVQNMSVVPTPTVNGCFTSWSNLTPRFGARAAVRPIPALSRVRIEAQGTIAPQASGDCTVPILRPADDRIEIRREPRAGLGDGRGPMGSVRVGVDVVRYPRGHVAVFGGAGGMRGLGRALAIFGTSGALEVGSVRLATGIEWMGTSVPVDVVATQFVNQQALAPVRTIDRDRVAGVLLHVGVQWRLGRQ